MLRILIIITLIVLISGNCFSQNPSFNHFTVDDGLPAMEIYHVIQDKKGFIWIATSKGVSYFDGKVFENFTVENGLPDNEILKIQEDTKGRIWFLSLTGKMSFYDGSMHNSSNTFFLRQEKLELPLRSFTPLSTGEILFCPQNNATFILTDTTIRRFVSSSNYSIFERQDHSVLMVDNTNQNISIWVDGKQKSTFKLDFNADYDLCGYNEFSDLLLIAKKDGLYYFHDNKQGFIEGSNFYTKHHLRFMASDSEGFFWVSANDGCYRFAIDSKRKVTNLKKYFEGFVVNDIYEDKDHNFWVSTRGEGLLLCPSLNVKLYDKSSGLSDNNVTAALKTKEGTILCGTLNGYLHVISKENKISETINLQSLRVQKIIEDKNQNIWIACEKNIFRKNKKLTIWSPDQNISNKTIALTKDGGILTGGYSCVYKIVENTTHVVLKKDSTIRFYSLCEGNNGELFLGTEKGVFIFKEDSLQPFHHERKPFTGWIDAIVKTKEGKILITTRDSGFAIVNNDRIKFVTTADGLQNNSCTSMYLDTLSEKIFLGTRNGFSIIKYSNETIFNVRNFRAANSLQCGSIYSIYEDGGEILLCTDKGLLVFREDDLTGEYEIPKIFLQKIEINNKEVKIDSSAQLQHNENNLKITYSGIAFRDPKSLKYRYKLIPRDTSWNVTAFNTIIYSELNPGKYTFLVQVRRGNDTWVNESATFGFEIAKPYWLTWWFRLLMVIGVSIVIYSAYRYRLNQSRKKHEIETELLQTELKALRAQINPHFIFNSLNSIQDFIFNNEKETANEYLTKFAKLMRMILDNSSKRFIPLSEEINFLKIYLQLESLRFANRFTYTITVSDNINTDNCYLPPMILQLYLENAIIHGLAQKKGDGKLLLSFTQDAAGLNCVIEDNGIGRKKSAEQKLNSQLPNHNSHGLNNTNDRLEALNKTGTQKIVYRIIDLEDENKNVTGTKIILIFPQG